MFALLFACASGVTDSASAEQPETSPAKWTIVELNCLGSTSSWEAWSQGAASSASLRVAGGSATEPILLTVSFQALGQDSSGSWQHWRAQQSLSGLPCDEILSWEALLLDSQTQALDCVNDDTEPC